MDAVNSDILLFKKIYLNTTTMITYQINTNFSGRPELALTYYPSVMEFYWFVGRTYTQLRRRDKIDRLPHQVKTKYIVKNKRENVIFLIFSLS